MRRFLSFRKKQQQTKEIEKIPLSEWQSMYAARLKEHVEDSHPYERNRDIAKQLQYFGMDS